MREAILESYKGLLGEVPSARHSADPGMNKGFACETWDVGMDGEGEGRTRFPALGTFVCFQLPPSQFPFGMLEGGEGAVDVRDRAHGPQAPCQWPVSPR